MQVITIILVLLLTSINAIAQESRGLIPEDFYKEVIIEQTALSPSGELLAYTVMTIDEEENERHSEIWMQPLDNGAADGKAFLFSNSASNASDPRWSPDGDLLSFVSKREDDENSNWFIRVAAPGGEAFHIEGVDAAPIWSPDGNWIAFVKALEDDELDEDDTEGAQSGNSANAEEPEKANERDGWVSPDAISDTLDAKRFDGRVYTTMTLRTDGTQTLLPHVSASKKEQLYVVAASGGEAVQLTDLAFDVTDVVWTGDSSTLLFTADEREDDEYNYDLTSQIYSISRNGGSLQRITEGLGSESGLAISPDGGKLAYLFTAARGEQTDMMVAELGDDGTIVSEPENLTANWELTPDAPTWSRNSSSVRWSTGITGNIHVFESNLRGDITQLTQGDRSLRGVSYASDADTIAYAATDPLNPGDLYVARPDGSRERKLTSINNDWLDDVELMPAERLTWIVNDGTEIEGWLIKPVGYVEGQSYPMILKIHGGPHSAYGNTWFRTFHVLSNAGFFVLYTNPRGSTGYGHDFTYATRGKWGVMDSEDFLTGVDTALAKYEEIDEDRLGVSGGSYGGFMTAWLSATTNRFAVANPSRMIANWDSMYGNSDASRLTEFEFFGTPWEVPEIYSNLSPITHVENVVTPTLIIHAENDFRVPIGEGEQWYIALKKRGVPAELVRYPRSSHDLSRNGEPWLLVDRLKRIESWFVHWLIDERVTRQSVAEMYGK